MVFIVFISSPLVVHNLKYSKDWNFIELISEVELWSVYFIIEKFWLICSCMNFDNFQHTSLHRRFDVKNVQRVCWMKWKKWSSKLENSLNTVHAKLNKRKKNAVIWEKHEMNSSWIPHIAPFNNHFQSSPTNSA